MTRASSRSRLLIAAVVAGAFVLSLLAMQLGTPSSASAQTSGVARQVAISLSNKTGANYHLWIGHQPPASQKAYVIPGGIALWYVDFKAGGRNANNVVYISDKLTVNAMKQGDVDPYRSLVTTTFDIRGFAKNIRVVWDGSRWNLLVDYEDDSGAKVAGGDGQASPSNAAPAAAPGAGGTAQIGGDDDIAGMTPDQLTKAANAAIIAILAGLLAGGLGAAAAEPAVATAGAEGAAPAAATPPSGPMDSGLRDPDSGEAVAGWEPGKYGAGTDGREGKAGDVWYGGVWQPAAVAAAQIQSTLDRRAAQSEFDAKQLADYRARNAQLDLEAQARQRAADAAARADREAQQRAISTMAGVRTAALQRGDEEMYRRATTGMTYGPDGKLDTDLVTKMRNTMVNRIGRDKGPEEPSSHWITEGFKSTVDDARHNPLIRLGTGILTGGASEIGYLGQSAFDATKAAAEKALQENRDFGYGDAMRAAAKAVAKERLPVHTIELIATKGTNITAKELAGSVVSDAMAANGIREGVKNLGASIKAARSGEGAMKTLTARAPAAPPAPSGPPKSMKNLPEGSPLPPGAGMSKAAATHQQFTSDKFGVQIKTRPVNDDVLQRLAQGDMPKPPMIKAKTISREDILLGAPAGEVGRVGYFPPKMPSTTGMSPEQIISVQKRFIQRRAEFNELAHDMQSLRAQGVTVQNGVVKVNGKNVTGDYDVYEITMKNGAPAPAALKQQVMADLQKPPFNAQHGAHKDWTFNPADPKHGATNAKIDQTIRETHAPPKPVDPNASVIEQGMANQGGVPLVTTDPAGWPPRTSFDHGEG